MYGFARIVIGNSRLAIACVFVTSAAVMTFYEFIKETLFTGRLSAWESHAITILVTASVATAIFGLLRHHIEALAAQAHQNAKKQAEIDTYMAIMHASNHYINNALNILSIIPLAHDNPEMVDPRLLAQVESQIRQIQIQIQALSTLDDPSPDKISDFLARNL
ncbi:MAG: hypothetical protein AB7G62_07410 [Magnetospirillum sp.]